MGKGRIVLAAVVGMSTAAVAGGIESAPSIDDEAVCPPPRPLVQIEPYLPDHRGNTIVGVAMLTIEAANVSCLRV